MCEMGDYMKPLSSDILTDFKRVTGMQDIEDRSKILPECLASLLEMDVVLMVGPLESLALLIPKVLGHARTAEATYRMLMLTDAGFLGDPDFYDCRYDTVVIGCLF